MKPAITITRVGMDECRDFRMPRLVPTEVVASTAERDCGMQQSVAEADLYWEQLDAMNKCELPILWVVEGVGSQPEQECMVGDCMGKTPSPMGCVGFVGDCHVRYAPWMIPILFAGFEYEAHLFLSCTDRSPAKKHARVPQLMAKYRITKGVSAGQR